MQDALACAQRHAPGQPDERMLLHRFAMGRERYQEAPEVWDIIVMTTTVQWLTMPRLAWSVIVVADPAYWRAVLGYVNMARSPEADVSVGGRSFAASTHDWRVQPATAWLDIMAERELLTTTTQKVAPAQTPPLIVLPEAAFREAVRQALRDFHRLEALRTNLLMRSRIVAGSGDIPADPAALREIVGEAVADLAANPKQERSHQALWHTCIVPAPSQEAAADVLGPPYSTFRGHLTAGIRLVAGWRWRRALGEPS